MRRHHAKEEEKKFRFWFFDLLMGSSILNNRLTSKVELERDLREVDMELEFEAQSAFLQSKFSENEVCDAIWDYGFDNSPGLIPNGCNSSFITLFPKNANLLVVNDYLPISLTGAQYKIIAKILTNRISCVLDSLISIEQSAFVKNCQSLDVPLMVNEIIAWYKQKRKNVVIFKIDFAKAFDSVS
ncbi:RNA-directed DNA polymerase, eukaryota, reverse transcriptase zinc-binding domain protein [Tanacetum coccineum]